MELGKRGMCVVAGALFLGCLAGCGDSARSRANSERNAQRQAEMEGTTPPSSGTPSFFPATSTKLVLMPGKVEIVQGASAGPMTLKIMVNAKQNISFGVVPRSETGNYGSPSQVSSAMEKLKCANSGAGNLSLTCEITESDKDMVIVVADMRDSGKAMRDAFDPKKRDDTAALGNEVSVDVFAAIPAKN